MRLVNLLILTLITLLPGAAQTSPASSLAIRQISIAGQTLTVEIADTQAARSYGLMNRTQLDANAGMLFVFPDEDYRSFYMKNTFIALSIAYIDKNGIIIEIYDMKPHDLRSISSRRNNIMYALEVNQGRFHQLGIRPGMKVENLPPPSSKY